MYLMLAIVVILLLVERGRDPLFALMAAPPVFVALFYVLSWSGLGFHYSVTLDLAAAVMAAVTVAGIAASRRRALKPEHRPATPAWELACLYGLAAAILALVLAAFRHGFLLPPVDPATVPSYARLIYLAGGIPETLAPMSSAAFVYPPGFSILVSTLWVLERPLPILWIFKLANLAIVALMPFAWSHFFRSTLGVRTAASPVLVATLFVAGFFIFDGTLVFAPVLAGKNAQLLALFLAPAVLHGLLDEHRSFARAATATLALAGAVLIHYSIVYIVALGIAFRLMVDWREAIARVPWLAAIGGASAALVVPHYLWMRQVGFALPAEYGAQRAPLACVAGNLTAVESKFFFIFHDLDLATRWPYRALVIAAIATAAVALDRWVRARGQESGLSPAARGVVASTVLLGLCLGLGCEVLPAAGAGYDYVRWFTFPVMVWLFVCAALVVRVPRWVQFAAAVVVPAWLLVSPMVKEARGFIEAWSHSRAEVAGVAEVLRLVQGEGEAAGEGSVDCRLVTSSDRGTSFETRNHIVQRYRPLEYAFVLSECRVVNGTINYAPEPHTREADELPSPAFYEALPAHAIAALFLEPSRFEAHRSTVPAVEFEELPYTLRGLRAYRVR